MLSWAACRVPDLRTIRSGAHERADSGQLQRWTEECHVERWPERRILRRHRVGLRDLDEERFQATRRNSNERDPSRSVPHVGPAVRYPARPEGRIAGPKRESLPADLDDVLALDDVEPLVLVVMNVARGPTLGVVRDLTDHQRAVAVSRRDLERERANAEPPRCAGSVVTVSNPEPPSCFVRHGRPPRLHPPRYSRRPCSGLAKVSANVRCETRARGAYSKGWRARRRCTSR